MEDKSRCRTPKANASGHRARRTNGLLRAAARAARHGLAAARCMRTCYDGEARRFVHEGQLAATPNVSLERLPLGSPLEGRVGLTWCQEAEATGRTERDEQTSFALKRFANNERHQRVTTNADRI